MIDFHTWATPNGTKVAMMAAVASGADNWQGVSHRMGALGVPILEHRLAIFECRPHARYDGGDHAILVGRVECFAIEAKYPPLT